MAKDTRNSDYDCAVCSVMATRAVSLELCGVVICAAALCEHHASRVRERKWGLSVWELPDARN